MRAYVALGSNQDQPERKVREAFEALAVLPGTRIEARSSLYRSPPWGLREQPDFINAVAAIETALQPHELMHALLTIETRAGRVRTGPRWGPRALDLDLLVYGDCVLDWPGLTLPHPRLAERAFVLMPLAEIAPGLDIPRYGAVEALLQKIDASTCKRLSPTA